MIKCYYNTSSLSSTLSLYTFWICEYIQQVQTTCMQGVWPLLHTVLHFACVDIYLYGNVICENSKRKWFLTTGEKEIEYFVGGKCISYMCAGCINIRGYSIYSPFSVSFKILNASITIAHLRIIQAGREPDNRQNIYIYIRNLYSRWLSCKTIGKSVYTPADDCIGLWISDIIRLALLYPFIYHSNIFYSNNNSIIIPFFNHFNSQLFIILLLINIIMIPIMIKLSVHYYWCK